MADKRDTPDDIVRKLRRWKRFMARGCRSLLPGDPDPISYAPSPLRLLNPGGGARCVGSARRELRGGERSTPLPYHDHWQPISR